VTADESQELLLTRDSVSSDLGEPRRDDAERPRPVSERRFAPLEDEPTGEADDGKVDRVGNLLDRLVPLETRNRLSLAVHRIGPTVKAAGDDVAKEVAADRAGAGRRAQHGHALGLKEGSE
jgi:hypothetical protein